MAIKEFLNTHHVFNRAEFNATFPGSSTDANLLARAVGNGRVRRVRHGLYISETDRFIGTPPSPFDIASKAVDDAVFCYLSALQLHGVLHNVTSRTQFYTVHRVPRFRFSGQEYFPLRVNERLIETQSIFLTTGSSYQVTSREQTVVDCLNRISLVGGAEIVLRSLSGFTYVDTEKVVAIAARTSQSACAKLGWLLEHMKAEWVIDNKIVANLRVNIGAGPYYFFSSTSPKDSYWSSRWSLYLPYPEEEMASWLRA